MLHRIAHLLGLNTGTVVSEWRLATINHRPIYYAVAIGFKCSHCGRVSGWHLTKNTMPLDQFPLGQHGGYMPTHEL